MTAILTGMRWCFTVVLIWIYLIISNVEYLFLCLLVTCMSSLQKYLLRFSTHFLVGLVVFLLLSCMSCLHILENKPLLGASFANISSQFVAVFLFHLLFPFQCESLEVWLGPIVVVQRLCSTLLWPHELFIPQGSSVHGISQARILEWIAISFSRESSWPRDWTQVSHIVGRFFTVWDTRETHA